MSSTNSRMIKSVKYFLLTYKTLSTGIIKLKKRKTKERKKSPAKFDPSTPRKLILLDFKFSALMFAPRRHNYIAEGAQSVINRTYPQWLRATLTTGDFILSIIVVL